VRLADELKTFCFCCQLFNIFGFTHTRAAQSATKSWVHVRLTNTQTATSHLLGHAHVFAAVGLKAKTC